MQWAHGSLKEGALLAAGKGKGGHGLRKVAAGGEGGGGAARVRAHAAARARAGREPRGAGPLYPLLLNSPRFFLLFVAPCACVLGYMGALWGRARTGVP